MLKQLPFFPEDSSPPAGADNIAEAVQSLADPPAAAPVVADEPIAPAERRELGAKHAGRMALLPVSSLQAGPNQRQGATDVSDLIESFEHAPLLQNVVARPIDGTRGKYEIIAGHRRVEAARQANWSHVWVLVLAADDTTAAIYGLEENLRRRPLADEPAGLAKLKELYAAKGARGRGGDRRSKAFQSGQSAPLVETVTAKLVELTHKSERQVGRDVKIGKSAVSEVQQALGAGFITKEEAGKLVKRPPEQQRQEVAALVAQKRAPHVGTPVELQRALGMLAQAAKLISEFRVKKLRPELVTPEIIELLREWAAAVAQAQKDLESEAADLLSSVEPEATPQEATP